ncbi:ribonuclease E inhibitor RraB [Hyalangium sp.]|uniref:ribonuclease E inhibitor RraB n=1 Tax=Hyalangium sp. TaxID=2028555 RepID=UPI002D58AFFD|nr:ribonuclease E inhibitor RraB [Hyalangium sp.]HYH95648.1 ribonuclease E inhibitor RraB [Hyalangium sp.]
MAAARKKARFGDVIEVRTPRGLAYLQYTSKHPEYSDTVRVLPGVFEQRPDPDELAALATQEGYFTFYLVSLAVRHGLVEIIGNYPIPAGLETPRALLRHGFITREGKVTAWVLEEGSKETLLKRELTPEEKHLSLAELWNHEFLVHRLAQQWRPEHEHAERQHQMAASIPPEASGKVAERPKAPASGKPPRMRHYLYFPRAKEGKAVAAELRQRGFTVESRKGSDGVNWLVLAEHSLTPGDEAGLAVREELERIAQQHSGEYDGSETALTE